MEVVIYCLCCDNELFPMIIGIQYKKGCVMSLPYSYEELQKRLAQEATVSLTPDIYSWYEQMQTTHALYYHEARASWLVFRYEDVISVMRDHKTFSSQRVTNPIFGVISLDPPRHTQTRALISRSFTPRTIALLEPRINKIVHKLLDQVQERGEMDAVDDLAFPLPVTVIAELLGVPSEDQDQFRQWSADVVGLDLARRFATAKTLADYFAQLIAQRRRQPREDLITQLMQGEVDSEHLSMDDIVGTCMILLIAGHETTTGLISNALACLDEYPQSKRDLIADPDLLPSAIEEVLRYRAVVHTMSRVVTTDTVFHGQELKAGDLVLPLFASANLDPKQFPDPHTFNIRRSPNHHLGFGFGIHFCLGAPLARLETQLALSALLKRFPNFYCTPNAPRDLRPSSFIYSLKHLPITLNDQKG